MAEIKIIQQGIFVAYRKKDAFRIYETESQAPVCNYFLDSETIVFLCPLTLDDLASLVSFIHTIKIKTK
jgi:hypothetical protein